MYVCVCVVYVYVCFFYLVRLCCLSFFLFSYCLSSLLSHFCLCVFLSVCLSVCLSFCLSSLSLSVLFLPNFSVCVFLLWHVSVSTFYPHFIIHSPLEVTTILADVAKHLSFLQSSVVYVYKHVEDQQTAGFVQVSQHSTESGQQLQNTKSHKSGNI